MKTRESDISELQYQVRKALLEPRDKRTVCVDAEVLQHLIDDVNETARLNDLLDDIQSVLDEGCTLSSLHEDIEEILDER